MKRTEMSRRSVLRTGAAGLATAAAGGLAGCGSVPFLGGGSSGGSYKKWLPAPDELTGSDHYYFSRTNFKAIRNNEDSFDEGTYSGYEDREWPNLGLDFGDLNSSLSFSRAEVLKGDYTTDDVTSELNDNDFDDDSEMSGFKIYEGPNKRQAYGVKSSAIISGRKNSENDAVEVVEKVIQAKNGSIDRYHQANDDFKKLVNKIGTGTMVSGRSYEATDADKPEQGKFENSVAQGYRQNVNGDTTKIKVVWVFESADDVDKDAFQDYIDAQKDKDSYKLEDVKVSTSGRTATISGKMDTDEIGTS